MQVEDALTIEQVPIGDLLPDPGNVRTHPPRALESLKAAIRRFGWRVPLVANRKTGLVEAGHLRLQAAQDLGEETVPVLWVEDDAVTASAFSLSENRLTELSGYDTTALLSTLDALKAEDALDDAVGWAEEELDRLRAEVAQGQARGEDFDVEEAMAQAEEDAPELICRVKRGQVWGCGQHRVMCGDATSAEDVAKLICSEGVDAILTDPPYCSGGFQEAGRASGSVGTRGNEMVANDTLSTRGYMALMKSAIGLVAAGILYVFTDWRMWVNLFDVVESSGYGVRNMIVWDKGTPGMGVGWRMQHELIMCGVRVKNPFDPQKAQGNVIQCQRTGNKLHAVEKPVELLKTILEVTDGARSIYDPFLGSGPSLIAAEKTGRVCYGMEICERYCVVSLARWESYSGMSAVLLEDV